MICGVLVPPMNAHGDSAVCSLVLGNAPLKCALYTCPMNLCSLSNKEVFYSSMMKCLYLYLIMIALLRVPLVKV